MRGESGPTKGDTLTYLHQSNDFQHTPPTWL